MLLWGLLTVLTLISACWIAAVFKPGAYQKHHPEQLSKCLRLREVDLNPPLVQDV